MHNIAISQRLMTLTNDSLTEEEKSTLNVAISALFNDLDSGHSCTNLQEITNGHSLDELINVLLKSGLANQYTSFPNKLEPFPISILSLNNTHLVYITKYLQYELNILHKVKKLASKELDVSSQMSELLTLIAKDPTIPNLDQLQAIKVALTHQFSVITGGPGTGKTTTVAILLWLLYQIYGQDLKIKICAPTGKASNRVYESISQSIKNPKLEHLNLSQINGLLTDKSNFLTIHKLLGYIPNSINFRHNQHNMLDLDILIIDESSMVSLPLFSKLLNAIDTNRIKHLILLGDRNQLSSVEEGYVFATLVNSPQLQPNLAYLVKSNRNSVNVGKLAAAIQNDDLSEINNILQTSNQVKEYPAKISALFEQQLFSKIDNSLYEYFKDIQENNITSIDQLFAKFNSQCVLCLSNVGIFGTIYLNAQIERRAKLLINSLMTSIQPSLFNQLASPSSYKDYYSGDWYTGRPIIILENDYSLELFNGDIGICVVENGKANIVFANGKKFIPEILPKYQLAYAITIHKSQGSEYDHVNLVLCDNSGVEIMSDLLTKELVYTGVTRAKKSVNIYAGNKVLSYAIGNKTIRNTGLGLLLESIQSNN